MPALTIFTMRSLLPLLLLAASACQTNDMSDDERERFLDIHVESAGAYLSMGDYGRAVDQAVRGLELDPDHIRLRLYLARGLQKTGRTEDVLRAEQVFRSMDRSEDYRVALGLGETIERRGLAQSEAAALVRTGQRFTEHPDPEERADELDQEATVAWREAIGLYKEALALAPADAEVLNGLVRAHTLLEENAEALAWGEKVIEVTTNDRDWWTQALKRPGMSPREEEACRRSIELLDRLQTSVHLNSYSILAASKDFEPALVHLDGAAELDPTDSTIHSRRAELLLELGRHEEAMSSIDAFLSMTDAGFDSRDVKRAFQLRAACEAALAAKQG